MTNPHDEIRALKARADEIETEIEEAYEAQQAARDRLGDVIADGGDPTKARAEADEARARYQELVAARPAIARRIRTAERAAQQDRNAQARETLRGLADERETVNAKLDEALATVAGLIDEHVSIGQRMTEALSGADLPQVSGGSNYRFSSGLGNALAKPVRRVREALANEPDLLARIR